MFYNHRWMPAEPVNATYYAVVDKTDSGWFRRDYYIYAKRLQMSGLFADSSTTIRNGHFEFYHANGVLSSTGRYSMNKKEGIHLSFHHNGLLSDSSVFSGDKLTGTALFWYSNGYLSDSITVLNDSIRTSISWHDNGTIAATGHTLKQKKSGQWNYFDSSGLPCASIRYDTGGTKLSCTYFDAKGNAIPCDSATNNESTEQSTSLAWKKYIESKIRWPEGYEFSELGTVVIEVVFTICESGELTDIAIINPFHPVFDKIALDAIRKSPRWQPAMAENRTVRQLIKQPFTFVQQ